MDRLLQTQKPFIREDQGPVSMNSYFTGEIPVGLHCNLKEFRPYINPHKPALP
jgi:hypothetical protein